ncbi:MAG: hypothetical protein FD126_806 [Elusimicrobia bacterium]|nr:MAG: hypothetical protein FD126_806 [Elusimicrobiota bacterium]
MKTLAALLALALAAAPGARAQEEEGDDSSPGMVRVGGFLLFYDSQGPLSFASATRSELPAGAVDAGEVVASACQHGLSIPTGFSLRSTNVSAAAGRGGYMKALERLRKERPELRGLYDLKVDVRETSVLRVWRRMCVELSARGFK